MPPLDIQLEVPSYDYAAAERLCGELDVSHVVAQVLVRRGLGDPARARAFLAAGVRHPFDAFGGLATAPRGSSGTSSGAPG